MKNKLHYRQGKFIARQGDVLIERVPSLPTRLTPVPRENGRVILAHGEATGHAHAISAEHCDLFKSEQEAGVTFLEVRKAMAALQHDEHSKIELHPGNYRIVRQREYHPQAIRNVMD